jgi:hypothetical protein
METRQQRAKRIARKRKYYQRQRYALPGSGRTCTVGDTVTATHPKRTEETITGEIVKDSGNSRTGPCVIIIDDTGSFLDVPAGNLLSVHT